MPKGGGRGRDSKYKPEYAEQVIELGRAGKSEAQMAASLGVPRSNLRLWRENHSEFLAAFELARDLAQAWWEDQAQSGDANGTIGSAIWKHSMNCRFREDYADRHAVEHSGDLKINVADTFDEADDPE